MRMNLLDSPHIIIVHLLIVELLDGCTLYPDLILETFYVYDNNQNEIFFLLI